MKKNIFIFLTILAVSNFAYASDGSVSRDGVNVGTNETQIAGIATKNDETSQQSMLQLSADIGAMADRINEMADKINTMADKIVKTQEIQSQNLKMTEENALKAQQAIINALQNTNDPEITKQLKSAMSSLENIASIKSKNTVNSSPVETTKQAESMSSGMDDAMGNMGNMGDMGGDMGGGGMGGSGGNGGGGF